VSNQVEIPLDLSQSRLIDFPLPEFPALLGIHGFEHVDLIHQRSDERLNDSLDHGLALLIVCTVLHQECNTLKDAFEFPPGVPALSRGLWDHSVYDLSCIGLDSCRMISTDLLESSRTWEDQVLILNGGDHILNEGLDIVSHSFTHTLHKQRDL